MTNTNSPQANDSEKAAKTGTTSIGLCTRDGVVMATDMRASLQGRFVLSKNIQKVKQIHPTAVLSIVGLIGAGQSFVSTMRAEANLYETRRGKPMPIKSLHSLAGNMIREGEYPRINPILGGVDDDGSHVASIDPAGGVMSDEYVVTGSGMQLAYGHLESTYETGLSNDEAVSIAVEAVDTAISRDTASGNGVYIAEITDEGVDIHGHDDISELL